MLTVLGVHNTFKSEYGFQNLTQRVNNLKQRKFKNGHLKYGVDY